MFSQMHSIKSINLSSHFMMHKYNSQFLLHLNYHKQTDIVSPKTFLETFLKIEPYARPRLFLTL